jgi:hypothetical protein
MNYLMENLSKLFIDIMLSSQVAEENFYDTIFKMTSRIMNPI